MPFLPRDGLGKTSSPKYVTLLVDSLACFVASFVRGLFLFCGALLMHERQPARRLVSIPTHSDTLRRLLLAKRSGESVSLIGDSGRTGVIL